MARVMLLGVPDPTHSQLSRDRDALERVLTNGIDQMAVMVLARLPADLLAAARPDSAALVAAFLERDNSLLGLDDVRNMVQVVEHRGSDAAVGSIRSVLDVLRLLDEFR